MMAEKRRAILIYAMLAVTTIALGTPAALAVDGEAALPLHTGPWPIRNGLDYQPTEQELRSLHQNDVTPHEAREIDRLYDQLLAGSGKVRNRHPAPTR
jgi:hypothetical protein